MRVLHRSSGADGRSARDPGSGSGGDPRRPDGGRLSWAHRHRQADDRQRLQSSRHPCAVQRSGRQIGRGGCQASGSGQEDVMKSSRWNTALALVVGLSSIAAPVAAEDSPVQVALGPKSTLWLEGTSTMHDYESTAGEIRVTMVRDAAKAAPANASDLESLVKSSGITRVDVEIPVQKMKSKKDGLDKNLYKTLKATEHPAIRCQLTRYTVTPAKGDTMDL